MHPEQIKAEMRMVGWTQAKVADDLKVSRSSVSQAITGTVRSSRIQKRIAEIIGKPMSAIWPNQVTLRRTSKQIAAQRAAAPQN